MMEHTDFIKHNLELFKKSLPQFYKFKGRYVMFNAPNWAQVMAGLDLYDKDFLKDRLFETHGDITEQSFKQYSDYLSRIEGDPYIEHKELLKQNNIVVKFERK
jgi:hypothetical protein